jgi:hypothetical protein
METGKANNIQASTFNINNSEQYHLSVQIGLQNLIYSIINKDTKNVEYFNNLTSKNLIDIINKEDNLKLNFASSSVSFSNFAYTLVPNEFFKDEDSKKILGAISDLHDVIKSDHLLEINTHLIYTIPNEISDIVFTFFPNAKQKAQQTILIEQFIKHKNINDKAYLHINNNALNICVFRKEKLIFNNSFNFYTNEDLLYFTLFVFEQLKLDPEKVETRIYGDIKNGDTSHQMLYEYIRNIKFGSRPNHLNFSSEFNKIEGHQFYSLFSQTI